MSTKITYGDENLGPDPWDALIAARNEVATLTAERDWAAAQKAELFAIADQQSDALTSLAAERDALAARLAQAERVVEAARAWREWHGTNGHVPFGKGMLEVHADDDEQALAAAVDALDGTAGPGEEGSDG